VPYADAEKARKRERKRWQRLRENQPALRAKRQQNAEYVRRRWRENAEFRQKRLDYDRTLYARKRNEVRRLLGNRCFGCGKIGRLGFHHLSYPNGETDKQRLHREVRAYPNNFRLLCQRCHNVVTILTNSSTETIINLIQVVADSLIPPSPAKGLQALATVA